MLAKLLKYELKACARTQCFLALAALLLGGLGAGMLRILTSSLETRNSIAIMLVSVVLMIVFISLVAYGVAGLILVYYRFYKNKFTDEGYLTFTLPVTSHRLIWSSFFGILIWSSLISLVFFLSVTLIAVFGLQPLIDSNLGEDVFRQMMAQFFIEFRDASGYLVLPVLAQMLWGISSILTTMGAIVLGCSMAKKHKILASVGIAYGVQLAIGSLNSYAAIGLLSLSEITGTATPFWLDSVLQIVISIILGIVSYLIMNSLMGKRLNLT